ncbi:TPA: hypothetical protein RQK43_003335 [Vibrio vulnificus]|uniref:hypothetical protein n=1 Tax=Vibrio vulnificus TaxID=672 RepID=UPI0019D423A9|nr:hypothetical protein [Vibrio vulnificus]MBN8143751.1 hypothetical protein [Vibrio vulnificus]HAS6160754.1 hypothetical protein [Vibrio vulnificus]HAT8546859.1 hypothetical protein [Vibrio vulnificus]HDY7863577.1 hypothetical protein [Vibrio vulnificus]HDY7877439.1 hypothetical protein [Vibrio vulnificus]
MVSRVHGNDSWWCGGGVQSFCSLALNFARLFLSAFYLVILAKAGTHGTASAVGWYYYCIDVVLVVCCGESISKRGIWCVDEFS